MTKILIAFFFFFLSINLFATNINGIVRDNKTGEVLVGATVFVKGNKTNGTSTGLDGSFTLKNIPEGKTTLVCSYISYQTMEKEITVPSSGVQKLLLEMVPYEMELHDVVVLADGKTSDAGVRSIERLSSNVLNIIGARSIEISPDINVGNVLSRLSGVTMERNSSGEAEYAVLRGMDKRYNITLVNGVKISSPNGKQRFVPLNIFPSELLDRLEVSKNRSADMEGDATGGVVNMVMKDAPLRFTITGNLSTGYSSIFFDRNFESYDKGKIIPTAPYERYGKSYQASMNDFGNMMPIQKIQPLPNLTAGFTVGNRFLNNKLGFIVAANYQNLKKGTNTTYFGDVMAQQDSTLKLTGIKEREYSENQAEYGVHAKIDYVFSKKHKLEWYNFYTYNVNSQIRMSEGTDYTLYYDPANGNYDKSYETRIRTTFQHIFASTLQGYHYFTPRFDLKWTAIYSQAGMNRPDQTYVNIDNLITNNVDNITIDNDGSDRRWEHNNDRDISGLFGLTYRIPIRRGKLKLEGGGLFRNKNRTNFYVDYVFRPVDMTQKFESIDQIAWKLYTPFGSVGPLTYDASENIGSGYLQANYQKRKLELILGVRAEYTDQRYHMAYPKSGDSPDGGQTYTDILPNFQLKYTRSDKINWKAGYFRSLSRPGYFEIVPYQIQEEEYTEFGNPNLKRTMIDNVDLRWEYFPKALDQLLIGAFYKNIQSPIEFAYYTINYRQSGMGLTNLGNAQNVGLEIDWIKYVRIFGVKANYTFTHSSITTPKVYYGKDENGNTQTYTKEQTRPLVGQAAHVANLSLLLKDVNHRWDGQLSWTYTGERIAIASRFLNSDYWDKPSITLDASLEKRFRSGFSAFLKANNLLNTPNIRFVKTHNAYNDKFEYQSSKSGNTIIRREYFYPSFLLGFRFKM